MEENIQDSQENVQEKLVYVERKDGCFDGCLKFGCGSFLALIALMYCFVTVELLSQGDSMDVFSQWFLLIVFSIIVSCVIYLMLYLTDSLGQERRKRSKDKPKKKFKDRLISEVVRFLKICCVCLVISITVFFVLKQFINNGSNTVPKQCTTVEDNLDIEKEAKSHVESFHYLFYTLTPDKQYIDYTMNKAMYLVDETGLAQYNTLKEKGFYDNIISSKSTFSVFCDSIKFDKSTMEWTYFGHQKIESPSNTKTRLMVTSGKLVRVPTSKNNPHGMIITNWRILENYNTKRRNI